MHRFPYSLSPSHILQLVKSYPFIHLKSGKGTFFAIRAELPRIGHYMGYPPGFMLALLAMSETISLPWSNQHATKLIIFLRWMSRFIYDVRGWWLVLFSFFILDLDECKDKTHQCDVKANCINIPGSYNCACRPGYRGNGSICNGIISYPSLHFIVQVVMFSL